MEHKPSGPVCRQHQQQPKTQHPHPQHHHRRHHRHHHHQRTGTITAMLGRKETYTSLYRIAMMVVTSFITTLISCNSEAGSDSDSDNDCSDLADNRKDCPGRVLLLGSKQ